MSGLPVLPPTLQNEPKIWNACLMSPESFEWTAQEGHNLLYVAYHVDHELATERISQPEALSKYGRKVEDHEVCCVYHAYFMEERTTTSSKRSWTALWESTALLARKRPESHRIRRRTGVRSATRNTTVTFDRYFPGRVVMGGPDQVVERIHELRRIGITQVSFLLDFGSLSQDEIMKSLHVFGDRILPLVREI